jgi:purine-nucleoside phosphorylase
MAGLVGVHPLRGPNIEEFGVRFPPLSDAYDLGLRRRTHKAWVKLGLDKQQRRLHEGVYAFVAGPTYVFTSLYHSSPSLFPINPGLLNIQC